jgi:DNA-binding NarL/FixJ family response regulator
VETLRNAASSGDGVPVLSPRDVELLRHLAAGRSTSQIASAMEVSRNTARTRIHRVMAKLAVSSRADAVAAAESHGLL